MLDKIRTEKQYKQIMVMIEQYLHQATKAGGFHKLNKNDTLQLQKLSILAEQYEDKELKIMPLKMDINSIVKQKINEMKLSQVKLASMLGIAPAKLSQILNGKRPADIPFLKAVHKKLNIDAGFLLENA